MDKSNKKRKYNLKDIWTQPLIKKLFEQYKIYECLYDTKNKFYTNKHARIDALSKICKSLREIQPKITLEDVKTKIYNIRSQVSHELQKIAKRKRNGTGTDDVYEPTVWWFEDIDFLISHMKPRKKIDSMESLEENNNEDSRVTQHNADDSSSSVSEVINNNQTSSFYSNQGSLQRKKQRFAKVKSQEMEVVQRNDSINKTSEKFSCLNNNISDNKGNTGPYRENEFGALVAKELSEIDDVALLLEAKHEINNIVYKYKKMLLQKRV